MSRISLDKYFMKIAFAAAERATCPRLSVGAVVVKDKQIISTGYNGSPTGAIHCIDAGCVIHNNRCVATVHAEVNAILQCALHGTSTKGASIYVTHEPCYQCLKVIINAGIHNIYYCHEYKSVDVSYGDLRIDMSALNVAVVSL